MLILLRLRGDSQPEPEFSGFFVHTEYRQLLYYPACTAKNSIAPPTSTVDPGIAEL
jgi:hypothetical protein